MSAGFARIQRFLRETAGIAIEDDKRYFIEDRLKPVLRAANFSGLDELAFALHENKNSDLAKTVAETLTINETSFFRDRALFAAFADRLLPQLLTSREPKRRLRIWCAGCSTGQEPYSVAMVIDEKMRTRSGWQVELLATDLSRGVIEQARRGIYSQFEVQRGVPVALLLRYFNRKDDVWQINDFLRAKIDFRAQNLLAIPAETAPFDVIFCRNVLFYFDSETRRNVLRRLSGMLADGGFLVLGGAERIGELCSSLRPEKSTSFVFVRTEAPSSERRLPVPA